MVPRARADTAGMSGGERPAALECGREQARARISGGEQA
jgi:hypothetical protein